MLCYDCFCLHYNKFNVKLIFQCDPLLDFFGKLNFHRVHSVAFQQDVFNDDLYCRLFLKKSKMPRICVIGPSGMSVLHWLEQKRRTGQVQKSAVFFGSRGRILRRTWDKSLKSFPPCYSKSPLLADFNPPPPPPPAKVV